MELLSPTRSSLCLKTKNKLAERAAELRAEWEAELLSKRPVWDPKRKKHVRQEPKWGYIRRTVDEHFPSLKDAGRQVSVCTFFTFYFSLFKQAVL